MAEARKHQVSLAGMDAQDRAVADYLGISLVELAEVNLYFHERTTMNDAIQLCASPRWPDVRANIARGHSGRLLGARIGRVLQIVVLVIIVVVSMRCLGVIR